MAEAKMTDAEKFRKAYAAEVKASAESKKRCDDMIEWTELQRQAAISSHAGQLRNTLAFKADVDTLAEALLTSTTMLEALLVQLNSWGYESAVNARGQIRRNEELLAAVGQPSARGASSQGGDK